MFKHRVFRKQQLTFMILNFIAFTIIFTVFSVIIYSQVQTTLFSQTDKELLNFKEMQLNDPFMEEKRPMRDEEMDQGPPIEERPKNNLNPRIIVLDWTKEGELVNQNELGSLFYENYLQDYELNLTNLNQFTNIVINDQYHFRYLLFENDTEDNEEVAYTQLIINTDAEQTILNNFGKLMVICSSIFITLSISASYLLSKKMMKPIIRSWNKQAEFVENASHELRTPLTIIQNKLELLLTEPEEKIINKFENIALSLSETRRLSKLTSDLLTLARADSTETELTKQTIQFDSFVKSVCAPYIEIAESQEKHFWLNLNSKVTFEADDVRLHQLFVIFLDNALKYTGEHDSIGVKTYMEDQKVVFEVTDTGIGINEKNMNSIFERFYREDKARSRETGGVGLGLSIAQWIVTKHGGTISVFKNQHKGTTFKVRLPK
ncbi:sensor histidine kinase [Bacillus suaedae]|uniref:histidine kinase n=1 Tax=Halalkalibacter suaedae TaxID=2822140 RepID=A0A940WXU0_9BACI|nr:HAMP domain-containing sensor histidine kinase [Bacillus suaedae]MBP3952657.1 HAMP domain-containing histidine kinase [Bacillus suaedae]